MKDEEKKKKFEKEMRSLAKLMDRYRFIVIGAVILTFIVTFIQLWLFR